MSKRAGFSLMEIIVAAFVIGIGFIAVGQMLPKSYKQGAVDKNRLTAIRIARNVIDRVRSMKFPDPGTTNHVSSLEGPVTQMGESVEGRDVGMEFSVTSVVTSVPAQGGSQTLPGFGTVNVTVQWKSVGQVNNAVNSTVTITGGLTRDP